MLWKKPSCFYNIKMGKWARNEFGYEELGEVAIIVAGTINPEIEKKVLKFFEGVVSENDAVYHEYLMRKNKESYPIVFNVYGASAMLDLIAILHDGGCRNIIFVGSAYGGFKNLKVGEIVIPHKSYHFEGVYKHINPERESAFADEDLKNTIERLFKKNYIEFTHGVNISVPSVTFQLRHDNEEYKKIGPSTIEMELSSCLSRARDLGMRAAGVLVISDNKSSSIGDVEKKKARNESKLRVLRTIIDNISLFKLPRLKVEKEFSIDEHLASIIQSPGDKTNVYKDNKEKELKEESKEKTGDTKTETLAKESSGVEFY